MRRFAASLPESPPGRSRSAAAHTASFAGGRCNARSRSPASRTQGRYRLRRRWTTRPSSSRRASAGYPCAIIRGPWTSSRAPPSPPAGPAPEPMRLPSASPPSVRPTSAPAATNYSSAPSPIPASPVRRSRPSDNISARRGSIITRPIPPFAFTTSPRSRSCPGPRARSTAPARWAACCASSPPSPTSATPAAR